MARIDRVVAFLSKTIDHSVPSTVLGTVTTALEMDKSTQECNK